MYVPAGADTFYMKRPYALCANGLRDASRPAIARIKPGCAPTLFTMQMNVGAHASFMRTFCILPKKMPQVDVGARAFFMRAYEVCPASGFRS